MDVVINFMSDEIGVNVQTVLRDTIKKIDKEFIVKHPQGRNKGESDYTKERDIKLRKYRKHMF